MYCAIHIMQHCVCTVQYTSCSTVYVLCNTHHAAQSEQMFNTLGMKYW